VLSASRLRSPADSGFEVSWAPPKAGNTDPSLSLSTLQGSDIDDVKSPVSRRSITSTGVLVRALRERMRMNGFAGIASTATSRITSMSRTALAENNPRHPSNKSNHSGTARSCRRRMLSLKYWRPLQGWDMPKKETAPWI